MTTGACSNDRCSFAHGVEDLRPVGGVYVPPALGPFQARHQVVQKISKNRICWVKQCRKPPSRLGMVSTYHSKKMVIFLGVKKHVCQFYPHDTVSGFGFLCLSTEIPAFSAMSSTVTEGVWVRRVYWQPGSRCPPQRPCASIWIP
jgi:hypothetical protein